MIIIREASRGVALFVMRKRRRDEEKKIVFIIMAIVMIISSYYFSCDSLNEVNAADGTNNPVLRGVRFNKSTIFRPGTFEVELDVCEQEHGICGVSMDMFCLEGDIYYDDMDHFMNHQWQAQSKNEIVKNGKIKFTCLTADDVAKGKWQNQNGVTENGIMQMVRRHMLLQEAGKVILQAGGLKTHQDGMHTTSG